MNRKSYRPSPAGDVQAHPESNRWTLVFVRELRHRRSECGARSPTRANSVSGRRSTPTVTSGRSGRSP